jgi:hypothetical protein
MPQADAAPPPAAAAVQPPAAAAANAPERDNNGCIKPFRFEMIISDSSMHTYSHTNMEYCLLNVEEFMTCLKERPPTKDPLHLGLLAERKNTIKAYDNRFDTERLGRFERPFNFKDIPFKMNQVGDALDMYRGQSTVILYKSASLYAIGILAMMPKKDEGQTETMKKKETDFRQQLLKLGKGIVHRQRLLKADKSPTNYGFKRLAFAFIFKIYETISWDGIYRHTRGSVTPGTYDALWFAMNTSLYQYQVKTFAHVLYPYAKHLFHNEYEVWADETMNEFKDKQENENAREQDIADHISDQEVNLVDDIVTLCKKQYVSLRIQRAEMLLDPIKPSHVIEASFIKMTFHDEQKRKEMTRTFDAPRKQETLKLLDKIYLEEQYRFYPTVLMADFERVVEEIRVIQTKAIADDTAKKEKAALEKLAALKARKEAKNQVAKDKRKAKAKPTDSEPPPAEEAPVDDSVYLQSLTSDEKVVYLQNKLKLYKLREDRVAEMAVQKAKQTAATKKARAAMRAADAANAAAEGSSSGTAAPAGKKRKRQAEATDPDAEGAPSGGAAPQTAADEASDAPAPDAPDAPDAPAPVAPDAPDAPAQDTAALIDVPSPPVPQDPEHADDESEVGSTYGRSVVGGFAQSSVNAQTEDGDDPEEQDLSGFTLNKKQPQLDEEQDWVSMMTLVPWEPGQDDGAAAQDEAPQGGSAAPRVEAPPQQPQAEAPVEPRTSARKNRGTRSFDTPDEPLVAPKLKKRPKRH